MNDKTKPDPISFEKWVDRFCGKYNSLQGVSEMKPEVVKKGYFLQHVFLTGGFSFLEGNPSYETPEHAAEIFYRSVCSDREAEIKASSEKKS